MSANRETANIWFYLKRGTLKGVLRSFRSTYLLHDSFGQYINRWFICPIFGHREIKEIEDDEGNKRKYCFACERFIGNEEVSDERN